MLAMNSHVCDWEPMLCDDDLYYASERSKLNSSKSLDYVFSRIAGTASGPEATVRQMALRRLAEANPEIWRESPEFKESEDREGLPIVLELVREPTNKYDQYAIRVEANDIPGYPSPLQLGYIPNSSNQCDFCEKRHHRYPVDGKCSGCGQVGTLVREGFATTLAQAMDAAPQDKFYAEVSEITGGSGERTHRGVNLRIRIAPGANANSPSPIPPKPNKPVTSAEFGKQGVVGREVAVGGPRRWNRPR